MFFFFIFRSHDFNFVSAVVAIAIGNERPGWWQMRKYEQPLKSFAYPNKFKMLLLFCVFINGNYTDRKKTTVKQMRKKKQTKFIKKIGKYATQNMIIFIVYT